jgi:hypothetical protein
MNAWPITAFLWFDRTQEEYFPTSATSDPPMISMDFLLGQQFSLTLIPHQQP